MRWMWMLAVGGVGALPGWAVGAEAELRGTWLTTTGYSTTSGSTYPLKDAATVNATFGTLRGIGLNSSYMDVWRDGYTWYPSPTYQTTVGGTRNRHPSLGTGTTARDLFGETLTQAHRNGMAQIGWYQYGFATQFNSGAALNPLTTYMQSRGWLLQDAGGAYVNNSNKFYWMNPLVPEVRAFIKGIVLDAVNQYDLDGIQFDDRLAWPVEFGYDNYTRNLYRSETGREVPANPADAHFTAWRSAKLLEFNKDLYATVKGRNPNLVVAVAPSLYPFSYNSYCVDWPAWSRETVVVDGVTRPLFDEYVPQVYSSNMPFFQNSWNNSVANVAPGRVGDLGAGISINNSAGAPYDWDTLNKLQVDYQRQTAASKGHVWWYADGVLNADREELTAYYDVAGTGQAARPDQDVAWRSTNLTGAPAGSNRWTFNVAEEGFYEVVYRVGSAYTVMTTGDFLAGSNTVQLPVAASGVELLRDRRPYGIIPGVVSRWKAAGGGSWTAAGNWTSVVPIGTGLEAQFDGAAVARTVTVDSAVAVGSVVFDNAGTQTIAAGTTAGVLTIGRASRGGSVVVKSGNHVISAPVVMERGTVVDVGPAGSKLTLSGELSAGGVTVTKTGAGTLAVRNVRAGGLVVSAGKVEMSGGGGVSVVGMLSLGPGATVDLNDHVLVVDYAGVSPIGDVRGWIAVAARGTDGEVLWGGAGITSSAARAVARHEVPGALTGLGYGEASLYRARTGGGAFAGVEVDETAVLVRYTFSGDADLDGVVTDADVDVVAANYGLSGRGWMEGDFDYDGIVGDRDLDIQSAAKGPTPAGLAKLAALRAGAAVPEPGAAAMLGVSGVAALRRRRTR